MYYFIYKTINKINGKYYIGMHKTDYLEDGYLGSGKYFRRALKKYGKENFEREILEYCNSDEEMYLAEARYITEDVVNDKSSYNLKLGGDGGWDYANSHRLGNDPKIASARFLELLKNEEFYKSWYDKLTKAKNTKSYKQNVSNSLKERWKNYGHPWTGRYHKESSKKKISEANSKVKKGTGNPQYGTCWISNTLIKKSIQIKKEFLYDYIAEGWIKKRIIKW